MITPFDVLAVRGGLRDWPERDVRHARRRRALQLVAICLRLAGVGRAGPTRVRSSSIFGSLGQPNQPCRSSSRSCDVQRRRYHVGRVAPGDEDVPAALAGGSFERAALMSVHQSIAWRSTVTPDLAQRLRVMSAARARSGCRSASMSTTGLPVVAGLLDELPCALLEVGLPCSGSAPVSLASAGRRCRTDVQLSSASASPTSPAGSPPA